MSVAADAMRRRSLDTAPLCTASAIITARMANTQSAKKRVRASLRKRDRNRSTRSAVKTLVSRARRPALPDAANLTSEEVRRAISSLDKAAEKGVL
ncbi:MAG: 30S ribosomal protein S20, partial [Chloroflexi bacterium]